MRDAPGKSIEAELYVFALPVFIWNLPYTVECFIRSLPSFPQQKKALAIITYASAQGNTATILQKRLAEKNIRLVDNLYIRAQDSNIFLKKYWKPFDRKDLPNAESFQKIAHFLNRNELDGFRPRRIRFNPLNVPHWIGIMLQGRPGFMALKFLLGKRIFEASRCTGCSICAELCPVDAIQMEDRMAHCEVSACIGCNGCINICPEHAWRSSWCGPEYYFLGNRSSEMIKERRRERK